MTHNFIPNVRELSGTTPGSFLDKSNATITEITNVIGGRDVCDFLVSFGQSLRNQNDGNTDVKVVSIMEIEEARQLEQLFQEMVNETIESVRVIMGEILFKVNRIKEFKDIAEEQAFYNLLIFDDYATLVSDTLNTELIKSDGIFNNNYALCDAFTQCALKFAKAQYLRPIVERH